jgi:S-adenosylhomocysteine hydrolase
MSTSRGTSGTSSNRLHVEDDDADGVDDVQSTGHSDPAVAVCVPEAIDRFLRPVRLDARHLRGSIWLTPDDAVSMEALRKARGTRTDGPVDDALGAAVRRAGADAPVSGSLALWVRGILDDALAAAPFGVVGRAAALATRVLEDALLRTLQGLAKHGVLRRDDVNTLPLSALDAERLFRSLRNRTPLPDLPGLLASARTLPLVVRDDDAPPTAWEVAQLQQHHPALVSRMLQTSSIPDRLDEIDAVIEGVAPGAFADVDGVFVQHVLGTQVPTFAAMIARGLDPRRVTIVGVPYSTSEVTALALRQLGFTVVTPQLTDSRDLEPVNRAALVAVIDAAADRLRTSPGRTLLVLDDGAKAAALLHERHPDLGAIRIVEQTARGITVLSQLPRILWPTVDVARSLAKHHEQDTIGGEVVAAVARDLARVGSPCGPGTRACVLGLGVIGTGVARALVARGCDVVGWDSDGSRRSRARGLGFVRFVVPEARDDAFRDAHIIVGCCGATSVHAADLKLVRAGCALASASSRNIEIDLSPLSDPAVQKKTLVVEGAGGGRFQTMVWRLKDKDVLLLHNGFPMNFDGRIETGTAASIAPTRALMLRGACQALGERVPGLHALR